MVSDSLAHTAAREVLEETGWTIDPASVQPIGLLHYYQLTTVPVSHPYPYPDFCQLVVTAVATAHAGELDTWTDTDGWEERARLRSIAEIETLPLTSAERYFIDRIR